MKNTTIDADGKILGRLAAHIAMALRGKNSPDFVPNRVPEEQITVVHTNRMRVTGRKMLQKMYRTHSGYLGHLKEEKLGDRMARDSREALRHAVLGMLPKNRLRRVMMRNLILYKGEAPQA